MSVEHDHFNISDVHELRYVVEEVYKRNRNTDPTAEELRNYIRELCKTHKYMTHRKLYNLIEKEYPDILDDIF